MTSPPAVPPRSGQANLPVETAVGGPARGGPAAVLTLAALGLGTALVASSAYGASGFSVAAVLEALTDPRRSHLADIVRTVRIPRALTAGSVGASLAVAGALMQAITRNPLAAPGILGINAGAALAIVSAAFLLGGASPSTSVWFALAGAAVAGGLVYLLGSAGRRGPSPLRLTLAGAALTALLASLTQGILVLDEQSLEQSRRWLAGSLAGRDLGVLLQLLPYMGVGLLSALALGREMTTLSLGEQLARGLGQRTSLVRAVGAGAVILLAGASVAAAGPIAFVGLALPHLARYLVGQDYRWVLPTAALLGAGALVVADLAARTLIAPKELPVGAITALLGTPFFIHLVRSRAPAG